MSDAQTHPVARPSAKYLEMEKKRKLLRTMRAGQEAMWEAGQEYLPALRGEDVVSPWGYNTRLRRTTLYPLVADAVGYAAAQVFQKEIRVKDADPRIATEDTTAEGKKQGSVSGWVQDIDRRGNDLHNFSLHTFEDYWWEGVGITLVDFPPDGPMPAENMTQGEEAAAGRRPFWTRYEPKQAIDWTYEVKPTGERHLTHIRLRESETKRVGQFESTQEERIRCFWSSTETVPTATFSVWTMTGNVNGVETWKETTPRTPLKGQTEIPVHTLGDLDGEPPLLDLGYLALSHYQMISDLRHIEHKANVPIPVVTGTDLRNEQGVVTLFWGPDGLLNLPSGSGTVEPKAFYLEHNGKAIPELKKSLDDIKAEARRRTMSSLFDGRPGDVTATSDVLNAGRTLSALQVSALKLKDFLEQCLVLTGNWVGILPEKCGSVEVNQKFIGLPVNGDALKFIQWAQTQGIIAKETALTEAQRQGWVSEALTYESEQEKIQEEGPTLGMIGNDASVSKRAAELVSQGTPQADAMAQAQAEMDAQGMDPAQAHAA